MEKEYGLASFWDVTTMGPIEQYSPSQPPTVPHRGCFFQFVRKAHGYKFTHDVSSAPLRLCVTRLEFEPDTLGFSDSPPPEILGQEFEMRVDQTMVGEQRCWDPKMERWYIAQQTESYFYPTPYVTGKRLTTSNPFSFLPILCGSGLHGFPHASDAVQFGLRMPPYSLRPEKVDSEIKDF